MAAAGYHMTAQQKKALARDVASAEKAYKNDPNRFTPQQKRELKAFIDHGKKGRDIRNEGGWGA